MLHIVPILCLFFFIFFIEIRLKRDMTEIELEFRELKRKIETNRLGIEHNKANVETNRLNIEQNKNNITKLIHD